MFRKIPIKDIELYYTILENGNIIDNETHEYVKYHINHDGYYSVYFKHLKSSFLVHRIIISKFIPTIVTGIYNINQVSLLSIEAIKIFKS